MKLRRADLERALFSGPGAPRAGLLATYAGASPGLAAGLVALASAIHARDLYLALTWAFFLLSVLVVGLIALRERAHREPFGTTVFEPFADVDTLEPWPRPAEVDAIVSQLDAGSSLVIVTGPSGAGKTVLLKRLLPEHLDTRGLNCMYIDEYADVRTEVAKRLSAGPTRPATRVVIVLDQFEQYLAHLANVSPASRIRDQSWLRELVNDMPLDPSQDSPGGETHHAAPHVAVVLALREEWFYDLRWIHRTPPLRDCVIIEAPEARPDDPAYDFAFQKLVRVLGTEHAARTVLDSLVRNERLLPLETQIVGAVLERDHARALPMTDVAIRDRLGGLSGAIDSYFDYVLQNAPQRRIALKILCALSARTRFRQQEDSADIVAVLFEPSSDVVANLNYLKDTVRLLRQPSTGQYELAHDYLAEYFHQRSGSELEPTDRDNILFHIERPDALRHSIVQYWEEREASSPWSFATVVVSVLAVLMTLRLCYFGIDLTPGQNGPRPWPIWGHFLDRTYAPIFVAHMAWSVYVGLFYHRVFRHLKETRRGRVFSKVVVLNMAACVVIAMVFPAAWLASIAWGGTIVGAKLMTLARGRELPRVSQDRFGATWTATVGNMFFVAIFGALAIVMSVKYVHSAPATRLWTIVSLLTSTAMFYGCLALARVHVLRAAVSRLFGLLARSSGRHRRVVAGADVPVFQGDLA